MRDWPPSAILRSRTENSSPSRATAASTAMARLMSSPAAAGCWAARMALAPALMIPAFSAAIASTVVPRYWVWSRSIGMTTATSASIRLVASHSPPRPTSTTATSTGASAKIA